MTVLGSGQAGKGIGNAPDFGPGVWADSPLPPCQSPCWSSPGRSPCAISLTPTGRENLAPTYLTLLGLLSPSPKASSHPPAQFCFLFKYKNAMENTREGEQCRKHYVSGAQVQASHRFPNLTKAPAVH